MTSSPLIHPALVIHFGAIMARDLAKDIFLGGLYICTWVAVYSSILRRCISVSVCNDEGKGMCVMRMGCMEYVDNGVVEKIWGRP